MVPRPLAPARAMRSSTCAHIIQPCRERHFRPKCESLVAQLKMAANLNAVCCRCYCVIGRIKKEQNFTKGKNCLEN